jgi:hypothetical protein
MKKGIWIMLMVLHSVLANAQSQEVQQLLLNVEKLSQFKAILQNMYDGYKVLHKGYTAIKDISEGNFSLHQSFLDALLQISPTVRNYKKVKGIIALQISLVKEYKEAFQKFKDDSRFSLTEINYIEKVYQNLLKESLQSFEELTMVLTAGVLRMNDEERLALIDKIYKGVEEQVTFLREFNTHTLLLSLQRGSEKAEIELSRKLRAF